MGSTEFAEKRDDLLQSIERDEEKVRIAVHELTGSAGVRMDQKVRTLIRQRPIVSLLVAVGAGYLAARLMARVVR